MQKLLSQFINIGSLCVHVTPRVGPPSFEYWGIRPPGDLLKECRCFLSSMTLWNYSDNIISQPFVLQSGTQENSCHLHPWWLGLWSFSCDLLSCLEIVTDSSHFFEEEIWRQWITEKCLHFPGSGIFEDTQILVLGGGTMWKLCPTAIDFSYRYLIFRILVIASFNYRLS